MLLPLPYGKDEESEFDETEKYWTAYASSAIIAMLKGEIGHLVIRLTSAIAVAAVFSYTAPGALSSFKIKPAGSERSHQRDLVEGLNDAIDTILRNHLHSLWSTERLMEMIDEELVLVDRGSSERPLDSMGMELKIRLR